jgi:release factor glutamine methyltransferase
LSAVALAKAETPSKIFYQLRTMNNEQTKLCKTNPISKTSKMRLTPCLTSTNNYEQRTMNSKKQTQSKPILPASMAGKIALSLSKGLSQEACSELVETISRPVISQPLLAFTFLCPRYNPAMQNWSIQKLLNWIAEYLKNKGVDSPRLSAELLLSHILGLKRIELYTQFEKIIPEEQLARLHDLVERAGRGEPIAYLAGKTEFYSLELDITADCMIPRPETELLVERAIEFLRTRPVRNSTMHKITQKEEISNGARNGKQFVCDLCTGSGCIAVAIAQNYPDCQIIATDISDAALSVAARNIEKHRLKERVKLLCGDLFDPLVPQLDVEKFDLIVCNPPYTTAAEFGSLDKNIKAYEPRIALYAGKDGLDVHRRIIERVERFLNPDAALMLEIGYQQGQAVKELLEKIDCFSEIKIEKDFNNNDRIAIAKKQKAVNKI